MKYLTLCFLFILGCKETPKLKPVAINKPELIRAFRNSGNWDSVYLYSDGHLAIVDKSTQERYFLISYQTERKDCGSTIHGSVYLVVNGFPSKNEIDSVAFTESTQKRSEYQSIIIMSVFEFRDQYDYIQFMCKKKQK